MARFPTAMTRMHPKMVFIEAGASGANDSAFEGCQHRHWLCHAAWQKQSASTGTHGKRYANRPLQQALCQWRDSCPIIQQGHSLLDLAGRTFNLALWLMHLSAATQVLQMAGLAAHIPMQHGRHTPMQCGPVPAANAGTHTPMQCGPMHTAHAGTHASTQCNLCRLLA